MAPLALGALVLGALGVSAYAYYELNKSKTVQPVIPGTDKPIGIPVTVTTKMDPGKLYALNVFAAPLSTPQSLFSMLVATGKFDAAAPRPPSMVKSMVEGTGYTFASSIDQWIVFIVPTTQIDLPFMFGKGGSDVQGVIKEAIEQPAPVLASGMGAWSAWKSKKKMYPGGIRRVVAVARG
jgi:hypothetical protein